MTRRHGRAPFVAGLGLLALAGCGTAELFGRYDIPESPDVAAAPWPRLVDVPDAPPVGTYTEDVPNPEAGVATIADLSAEAAVAEVLSDALAGPVVRSGAAAAALAATAARAAARAEALAEPVIDEAERREMLSRARRARDTAR